MFESALSVFLFSCLLRLLDSADNNQVTVERGENVTLECHGSTGDVVLLRWSKPDQENHDLYVFYFRDGGPYENLQLPSFRGRVQLRDPQMKDGDLSVIIKDVSMNDAAIYECYAGYDREEPQLMSSTNLKVEEPDNKPVTVKRGENATLECHGSTGAAVVMLKWSKPELENKQLYVFFFRDGRPYEKLQFPSFKGRVQLRDPQMKDGDLSVIIKNVSMNDAGIYECYTGYGRGEIQLLNTITLKVEEPGESGQRGGQSGDGEKEDGGEERGSVGLIVGVLVPAVLLVVVVVVVVVGFIIYRRHRNQPNQVYHPDEDQVL